MTIEIKMVLLKYSLRANLQPIVVYFSHLNLQSIVVNKY